MNFPGNPFFDAAATATATAMSIPAKMLYSVELSNPNAADAFLQLFDLAVADVTLGSTTPTLSFFIPAGDGTLDAAMDKSWPAGVIFNKAITYAVTTTPAGNTAPSTALPFNAVLG